MQLIRLLRTYTRPYSGFVVAVVVLQLVGTIASLYLPSLNGKIIDEGVAVGDTGRIWSLGGWMLLVSLVNIASLIAVARLGSATASGFGRDVRGAVFRQVLTYSDKEMNQFGAPTLITRTGNDVTQIQQVLNMLLMIVIGGPIMMVGGVVMGIREDPGLAWIMAVAVPALGVVIGVLLWRMIPWFGRMQSAVDGVNRVLREQITGVRVVRAFVREDVERARFGEANDTYTDTSLHVGRLMAMAFPTVGLIFNLSNAAVLWWGAHRVADGHIKVGALTAFVSYLMQVLMAVMMSIMVAMTVPRAVVSSRRIGEVLDTSSSVRPPDHPVPLTADRAGVELRDVTFAYPGAEAPVLEHVSLVARPGTTTAVIGSTGSGKSTLLSLVPRLYDVSGGAVLIGGVDVREAAPEDVWGRIGIVPQKPYLFTGTVASNLRYGKPDATDEECWTALETAQAADFVRAMDGGLEASIAQGGTNVSGGQRQRLAIARALIRRPDILLFDDSFSALDLATDARLRAALAPVTRDTAVVVVAQRVSTIVEADQIVVLDDGHVVGVGTHAELLAACPTYVEIAESQKAVAA